MATFFWDVLALFLSLTLIWTSSFLITGISFDGTQEFLFHMGESCSGWLVSTAHKSPSAPVTFRPSYSRLHHFWRRKILSKFTHYSYNGSPYSPENTCCRFWYSPCLSLSDTYFFPLLLPAQMMIPCTSCGCWGFLSMSLNLGLPEDTSLSLFCGKSCQVFYFVT